MARFVQVSSRRIKHVDSKEPALASKEMSMKAYRPSHFADAQEPVDLSMDPDRLRRIVVYRHRAAGGRPLFDNSTAAPMPGQHHKFPRAKAG